MNCLFTARPRPSLFSSKTFIMERTHKILTGLFVLISIIYATSSASIYDISVVSDHCLKDPPVKSNYTPRGNQYEIGNLTVYESDNRSARRLLIAVYDIFGFANPNMMEVVDTLANQGNFRVVMPDFFRGIWWDQSNFPPSNPEELQEWLARNGSWTNIVKWDVKTVIDSFAQRDNITEVGIFGMCWGGKVAVLAATELPEVKVASIVHPASVANEEADGVQCPMYLMPSQNEPDMLPFYEVLREKFGDNSGHRRFDDMFHGFAGARGNFSNPLNRQRVDEVIDIMDTFFNDNLN